MTVPYVEQVTVVCHRVAREPDPLVFTPYEFQTWDGRYDDPDLVSRTLYLADSTYGAWCEVLARFRPDKHTIEALDTIADEPGDAQPTSGVQMSWLATRRVGKAEIAARHADVSHSRTLRWLDTHLADLLADLGYGEFDLSVATGSDRSVTQQVAKALRVHADTEMVSYASRLGTDVTCSALFEDEHGGPYVGRLHNDGVDLDLHDEALHRALAFHDLPLRV